MDELDPFSPTVDIKPPKPDPPGSSPQPGRRGGDDQRYEFSAEVGRGGIGVVWRALDRRLKRTVAIKRLRGELAGADGSSHQRQRFLREALVTARLQHPSIVPVYDAGMWDGAPYYSMKLVTGRTLGDAVEAAADTKDRMALLPHVLAAAEAMAYSHGEGVIHRDLKPANILTGAFGETVVVDWGLAKERGRDAGDGGAPAQRGSDAADLTQAGQVMGTPSYMSPEQARGELVDARADVYALGAILYHVVAGAPPHHAMKAHAVLESKRAGTLAGLELPSWAPSDLVAIVDKSMGPLASRYASARAFAADLRRFQNGQLVGAYRYSLGQLVSRWFRRHLALVAVVVVALAVLGVGAVVSVRQVLEERDVAAQRAEMITLQQARSMLRRDPTATVAWLKSVRRDENADGARLLLEAARRAGLARHVLAGHSAMLETVAVSSDGRVATAGRDRTIQIWRADTGRRLHTLTVDVDVFSLAFSPSGDRLVASGTANEAWVWDTGTGALVRTLEGHSDMVWPVLYAPDGRWIATASYDNSVRLWPTGGEAGSTVIDPPGGRDVLDLVWAGDGGALAAVFADGSARVWSVPRGEVIAEVPADGGGRGVAVAFDGDTLVIACEGSVRRWSRARGVTTAASDIADPITGVAAGGGVIAAATRAGDVLVWTADDQLRRLGGHDGSIHSIVLDAGGERLATAGADGTVLFVDLERAWSARLRGHGGAVKDVAFLPAGAGLVSVDSSAEVRVWAPPAPADATAGVRGAMAALIPGGDRVAIGGADGVVSIWRLSTGAIEPIARHAAATTAVVVSAAGDRLVIADASGAVRAVELATGDSRVLGAMPQPAVWLAMSPDGDAVAAASKSGDTRLWRLADGSVEQPFAASGAVEHVVFSPRGRWLAGAGHALTVIDRGSGRARRLFADASDFTFVGFARDDSRVVAASADGAVRVAWLDGDRPARVTPSHRLAARKAVFLADGSRVVTFGKDQLVRIVDADSAESQVAGRFESRLFDVEPSPRGDALATSAYKGKTHLWPTERPELSVEFEGRGELEFSADGRILLVAEPRGDLVAIRLDLPRDLAELRAWMTRATTAEIAEGGKALSAVR